MALRRASGATLSLPKGRLATRGRDLEFSSASEDGSPASVVDIVRGRVSQGLQAAHSAPHHDPESKAYYQKKLAGRADPKAKTVALLALARHRVRRL